MITHKECEKHGKFSDGKREVKYLMREAETDRHLILRDLIIGYDVEWI
jgi:hypothetical protein